MQRFQDFLFAIGQRIFTYVPERLALGFVRRTFRSKPEKFGFLAGPTRIDCARRGISAAYPEEDVSELMDRWLAARIDGMARSAVSLARIGAERRTRLTNFEMEPLKGARSCVVTYLHYSIDPVIQTRLILGEDSRQFKWPMFPMDMIQDPEWADERALWSRAEAPDRLRAALLPVTDATWVAKAASHLRGGGDILIAMDVGLDSRRREPSAYFDVGETRMPVAPAIELLAGLKDSRLFFASPELNTSGGWDVAFVEVDNLQALADAASDWIARYREHWVGWPWLACREDMVNVRKFALEAMGK